MGRIHRYGQQSNCLIFNFVATNTIEGKVLERLLDKLQEIRDAVFNVVGEVLPTNQVERVLRDYYAGKLRDADLEDRLLRDIDENHFREICQHALDGLASKKLNLEMLVERRTRIQERRIVLEAIARFLQESAKSSGLTLKPVNSRSHTFDPGPTPSHLKRHELSPRWKLQTLANRYPRLSTDRDTAENNNLEWVTRGHPLFEALRRSSLESGRGSFAKGACFHSLGHESPARLDFYKAQVTDGLGQVIHERLFAVEISDGSEPKLRGPEVLGNLTTAERPSELPTVVSQPEPNQWLYQQALNPLLDEVKEERIPEIDRITEHELAQGKQVYDVHGMNLGYDMTSLDLVSGEPRFIEVKGLPAETGTILLTPNERRVAEDRRDCYWLHIVTNCAGVPVMQEPIQDPAKFLGMR